MTKYQYFIVIKQKYSNEYGFEDVSVYETNSNFSFKTNEEKEAYKKEWRNLKWNGYPIKISKRRTIRK